MLDVVIVGAGVAGLSAGISLRRAGHVVRIYERSDMDNEVGAAINVPPNATRFLTRWGLDPKASGFVKAGPVHFQDPVTMEITSTLSHADNEEFYDADLWYAHRVDLHDSLKRIATDPAGPGVPVTIHPNSWVVGYNPELPAVHLQDGDEIECDLVVGADGIHSIAAETVLGRKNPAVAPLLHNCCYRFLIPAEVLEEDSETKFWNEDADGLIRLFPDNKTNRRLVSYPCRNNTIHNFVGIFHDEDMKDVSSEDYQADVDKAQVIEKFAGFHPSLLAIINKATEIKRWPLLYRAPLPTWRKGKMVITGDAAHPMLPHQGQGGAMGLEDGLALGVVFAGVSDNSDLEKRLDLFEKIRRNRASAIQILSNVGTDQSSLVEKDLLEFLAADEIPKNPQENLAFNFGYDVVNEAIKIMEEYDPSSHLPHDFFEDDSFDMTHVNGELSKMSGLGFIKVETCINIDTE
ncbi:FAD binding domain-containing protein [Colletotrichum costaricense]|uniref:FAD binding domain-containing protein n=1 Tax=Colletotrichum costaricense TaxID=1209916 RepID=A0AAJ0DZE4_9PEZI|nr:FAD binding domain-containing protein [Colletotrichum costaricense]KAK1525773.1 FAD binding domain-containing protein [Colletotrichum costaricense]